MKIDKIASKKLKSEGKKMFVIETVQGQPIGNHFTLPKVYKNKSFGPNPSDAQLMEVGLKRIVLVGNDTPYDPDLEFLSGPVYMSEGIYVSATYEKQSKDLEEQETNKLNKIENAYKDYIDSNFTSTEIDSLREVSLTDTVYANEAKEVLNWLDSVKNYYFSKRDTMAVNPSVSFDFSAFDNTKPIVDVQYLKLMSS